jgi:hypothetical protein
VDDNNSFFFDKRNALILDEYGFPDAAIANKILAQMTDYGESRETLETSWESWIRNLPFDTSVAAALDKLYHARLSKLTPEKDEVLYYRLTRKEALLQDRIKRYQKALFLPNGDHESNEDSVGTSP